MKFTKAHGLGNDFILIEAGAAPSVVEAWARRLCDRHLGIGGDGVLLFAPEAGGLRMQLINADGSDGEISGNGVRCLAAYGVRQGLVPLRHTVFTAPGPRPVEVSALAGSRYRVKTDLGPPLLASVEVPVSVSPPRRPVLDEPVRAAGRELSITATSLGNPHCAVFLEVEPDDAYVAEVGAALEQHPLFPRRTNVEFVAVRGRGEIRVRFWERGVGPTRASGTGSASAAVAAILKGLVERELRVVCDGGVLEVAWPDGGHVEQHGEVEILFQGSWAAAPVS